MCLNLHSKKPHHTVRLCPPLPLRCLLLASHYSRGKALDRPSGVATERLDHLVQGYHHGFTVTPAKVTNCGRRKGRMDYLRLPPLQ
jgi:hypothetical protein